MRYLPRDAAPFSERMWKLIEEAVVGAASSQLAGRRLLAIEGPLGLGARTLEEQEEPAPAEAAFGEARARMTAPRASAIPTIYAEFSLPIRDIAAVEERGGLPSLSPATQAAIACARMEESLVFHGHRDLGLPGLLTAPGAAKVKLGDWSQLGRPLEDLIQAVGALDAAGFPGPYAAALAPGLYHQLFRIYERGNLTQLQHARQLITAGLVKAPALASGGVVLASERHFASIVVAQDLTPEFVGPRGLDFDFVVLEALAPRIAAPEAICVLEAAK